MEIKFANFVDFKYWFVLRKEKFYDIYENVEDGVTKWVATGVLLDENQHLRVYDNEDLVQISDAVDADWVKFSNERPEGRLYAYLDGANPYDSISTMYLDMLKAVCLYRVNGNPVNSAEFKNPDKCLDKYERIKDWLISTDFFDAPASASHHDAFEHGLLFHIMENVKNVVDLLKLNKFVSVNPISAILCALTHDWCKINFYLPYMKNVKNDETGVWEQVKAYRYSDTPAMPFGHGETSLFYAQKCFNLSVEEALAIRWHMGAWNVCDNEKNDLRAANMNYPLVHLIQFADQLSITNY